MKRSPIQRKTPMKRTGKPLARSRLNPVSKDPKKRKANAAYEAAKRKWRAEHDGRCEMMFEYKMGTPAPRLDATFAVRQCHRPADRNPHHMKGRGRFLSDAGTFLAVCLACHNWIDTHRRQATALGYFIRVNPNPDNR